MIYTAINEAFRHRKVPDFIIFNKAGQVCNYLLSNAIICHGYLINSLFCRKQ